MKLLPIISVIVFLFTFLLIKYTFTAVGAFDKVTNVPAASYRTAGLLEFSKLYIQRMKRERSDGFAWHT
jgi:hypothetical protein